MILEFSDFWPVPAFMAICYGMVLLANATEYWLRRHARRRARVMLAPEPDLTGCIQRASMAAQQCGMERNGHF